MDEYVQPIKWKNVKISDCYLYEIGLDGIQTSAIDGLEICNNEVTNRAMMKNWSHNGGILIGGRTTNTHDNYVHDGWGEMCQFYGSGENNASATEDTRTQANVKVRTIGEAKVNVDDLYQPLSGSPIGNAEYRK